MEYTPEEIEKMRADRSQAEALAAARAALYAPLKTLVEGEAWSTVLGALVTASDSEEDHFFSVHVKALAEIMPRLVENIGLYVPLDPELPE